MNGDICQQHLAQLSWTVKSLENIHREDKDSILFHINCHNSIIFEVETLDLAWKVILTHQFLFILLKSTLVFTNF